MIRQRLTTAPVLVGAAVWAASFGLYLSTLAPTLTWGYERVGIDGGELLAAADTLGIPHPPGYPTYVLLLKLFATVVPIGDFAYRGNLLSAVLASLSVAVLYWVVVRLARHLRPEAGERLWLASAALGATVFATSPLFWSQAVITEVYTLNALFAVCLVLLAVHIVLRGPEGQVSEEPPTFILMALFGLLLGLGLGNHLTLLGVAVPLVLWLWSTLGWRRTASPWAIGALILGLGIYVYLPIRASQDPPVNWGAADTLEGFGWMLTGRIYQDYVFGVPASSLVERTVSWVELVFSQLNPLGLFGALLGAAALRSAQLKFFLASLFSIAVLSVYSITYSTIDSDVLVIPAIMLAAIWVGVGFLQVFHHLSTWAKREHKPSIPAPVRAAMAHPFILLVVVAFGALPLTAVILNYSSQNQRENDLAFEFAREVMDAVPVGSVVLSSAEDRGFSLWYMSYVEEPNRKVAPVAVPLLQFDWYWETLHSRHPGRFPAGATTDVSKALERIVEHNDGSSKVFFTYRPFADAESMELTAMETEAGLLFEAIPKRAP